MIKECELLEALEKGWIREAILDVFDTGNDSLHYNDFEELFFRKSNLMIFFSTLIFLILDSLEPLPPNHPFWKNEKITITPHCAALSRPKDIAQCFKMNYELFENDKPFISCVNWNEKY